MYSGDRLDRIYQLLEDNPVTRWLPTICDDSYNDHELWSKLIEFLEKELTVQQQKLLMQGKSDKKKVQITSRSKSTLQMQPNQIHVRNAM